jgi:hypothetical protein
VFELLQNHDECIDKRLHLAAALFDQGVDAMIDLSLAELWEFLLQLKLLNFKGHLEKVISDAQFLFDLGGLGIGLI